MKHYDYIVSKRLDMLDPSARLLYKLNRFVFIAVLASCVAGVVLNYCLLMLGYPGGRYFLYILCGTALCFVYPYVHEAAHALAIFLCRGKMPQIRFGKLAAYCGSPDIFFSKPQYFFSAVFPFAAFCALLIPLCILLPHRYFPIVFMPLMYNGFGSVADFYMIDLVRKAPKNCIVVDAGTEVVTYIPVIGQN